MIRRVTMPKWGLSMERGRITDWFVAEGDEVKAGDDLADIDTDKINGTLEAPGDGVLRRLIAAAGEEVPVGGTIALLAEAATEDAELDEAARQARAEIDAGAVAGPEGPVTGTVEVGGRTLAYATLGTDGEVVVLVHGYGGDKNSWLFVQEPLFASPDLVTRRLADDLLRYKRRDGVDKVLATLLDTLLDGDAQRIDAARLLSEVDVPVRVVRGREDRVLPPGNADAGNAEYVDNAGHMVHLEAPGAVITAITG